MKWSGVLPCGAFAVSLCVVAFLDARSVRAAELEGVHFTLTPVGASHERGTVTLVPVTDSTTLVRIRLAHQPAGIIEPTEIHSGTCAKVDRNLRHTLTSVLAGKSDTKLEISETYLMHIPTVLIVRSSRRNDAIVACAQLG